ncbi:MAG: ribosome biogenesis GTPase YlqF [Lachnospiraceae bacterium]|nr:ribosome biogenesis GTPase YlqF [Lachnospiraceae bacterium]
MDENKQNINWFPGHMAKTRRMMEENIKLVDVVVEVVDARIPASSKNPYLDQLWNRRPRIIAMNKTDLADPAVTERFKLWYEEKGFTVVMIDALKGKNIKDISRRAVEIVRARRSSQNAVYRADRPVRMMITGIPNVGKSTVINQLAHRSDAAKTGNKPGVTKGKQWIRLQDGASLLDTPGILWPKFDDQATAWKIAFIGSISDGILDTYNLCVNLLDNLKVRYGSRLTERYGIDPSVLQEDGAHILEAIGRRRGHLKQGGQVDVERTCVMVVDEFRSGKLGRISLETPEELTAASAAADAASEAENGPAAGEKEMGAAAEKDIHGEDRSE